MKFSLTRRRFLVVARYLTAATLGLLLAFSVGQFAHAQTANAAPHCTHYTPPYTQDNQYGCADLHPVSAGSNYHTNGVALRDDNTAAASPNQNMCVHYEWGGASHYTTCVSNGPSVHIGIGSGSNYAYSDCVFTSNSNSGVCETTWHD